MDITWEFILRIFVAAMLGGAIGLEREYRAKEAGLRTHFLVAMGSALFMIVSAYGFDGIKLGEEQRWDVARIAAQVVTGIGFIGAGTIIFHKSENVIRGLTTAAGVWVTAAIGLACGGGMYILAIVAILHEHEFHYLKPVAQFHPAIIHPLLNKNHSMSQNHEQT